MIDERWLPGGEKTQPKHAKTHGMPSPPDYNQDPWSQPPAFSGGHWRNKVPAGEVLAMQVDMLAYVDESGPEPVLVIGAGVPRSWLARPFSVRGLPTCLGTVDWTWTGNHLATTVHGRRPAIRAAEMFH